MNSFEGENTQTQYYVLGWEWTPRKKYWLLNKKTKSNRTRT